MFMELTYAGEVQIEKVMVNLDFVTCLQKPKNDNCGCIVIMGNGDKYPVKETYTEVIDSLKKIYQHGGLKS